mmetsp:Transcript_16902/g.49225  ORF Transcript_16902/g.49225 Transcript_16902/m.49225 type:complete len:381 (-) Transcript_16902:404-1546(-)
MESLAKVVDPASPAPGWWGGGGGGTTSACGSGGGTRGSPKAPAGGGLSGRESPGSTVEPTNEVLPSADCFRVFDLVEPFFCFCLGDEAPSAWTQGSDSTPSGTVVRAQGKKSAPPEDWVLSSASGTCVGKTKTGGASGARSPIWVGGMKWGAGSGAGGGGEGAISSSSSLLTTWTTPGAEAGPGGGGKNSGAAELGAPKTNEALPEIGFVCAAGADPDFLPGDVRRDRKLDLALLRVDRPLVGPLPTPAPILKPAKTGGAPKLPPPRGGGTAVSPGVGAPPPMTPSFTRAGVANVNAGASPASEGDDAVGSADCGGMVTGEVTGFARTGPAIIGVVGAPPVSALAVAGRGGEATGNGGASCRACGPVGVVCSCSSSCSSA